MIGTLELAVVLVTMAAPPPCPYDAEIASAAASVAVVHPVPVSLVRAIIATESGCRPEALSPAGARGLMQLLPETAAKTGIRAGELFTPERNIMAGTRLLAVLLRHYQGDLVSVLVAYNAGPRRAYAPIPENGETPLYVAKVLAYLDEFSRGAALSARVR